MNKKLLALLFISQLSFSEETRSAGLYKFPELEPVKPMPLFDTYDSQCVKASQQNNKLFKITIQTDYPIAQRRILQEGWAVLKYDVTEGSIENIELLDSSQEKTFGVAAINSLKQAKLSEVNSNAQGCFVKFIYKLEK